MRVARWIVVVLGIVGLVAFAGAVFFVRGAATKRWSAAVERQRTVVERLRADDGKREPLAGRTRTGNAWEDYEPAFAALAALSDAEAAQPSGLIRTAVLRVRDGAGRPSAAQAFDPASPKEPAYQGAIRAVTALAGSARDRREAGDPEASLNASADALQVAADVGRIPRHAALMAAVGPLANPGLDELKDLAADSRTPSASLARIWQVALGFERQLPSSARAFSGEHAVFVEGCRRFLDGPAAERGSRWAIRRFAFSWRLHAAFLADNWNAIAEDAGWRESAEWANVAAPHVPAGGDPNFAAQAALPIAVPSWPAAERRVREARARLRLVQAAIVERLGRDPSGPEWPVDPFTLRPIHRRVGEGTVVFWSEWIDGDQAGVGSWRPEAAGAPQDMVLELRR
jgi:hypothetical protein